MPRGYYGKARANAPVPQRAIAPPAQQTAVVVGAVGNDDDEHTSSWKVGVAMAAAVTGIVALGAVTTSFTGPRRRKHGRTPRGSLYASLY